MADEMRELYGKSQEVEVKHERDDGWIWLPARVILDEIVSVKVWVYELNAARIFPPERVRKQGGDKE